QVLENFSDAPMTPKQILHVIETKGLKEMSGTSPLACLNTMLHSQCRGEDGIFFKLPGRLSLFTLKKDALQWSKTLSAPDPEEAEDTAEVESCDSNETATASGENDISLDETSSSASCSTEPQSRLSRSSQQTGRQRKKGVLMPRVVLTPLKVNGEHGTSGFPSKLREVESSSSCSSTSTIACSTSLRSRVDLGRKHGQHFKTIRKAHTGQMKRNRGVEVDFETPGSILVNTNIRALINTRTFAALPPHYQQQLLLLLPEVDRQVGADGLARLSGSALNNEFFAHASQCWKERLADGEFTHEMQVRFRQEMEKEKKVELWKEKFFEEYYGQRSGLTKEESLKLTAPQENTENQASEPAAPAPPPKRRTTGRRRKDGRMRRRSRTDLRRRARRPLCKQPKAQEEKEKPYEAAAASASAAIEASSQVELAPPTDSKEAAAQAQAAVAVSAQPVSLPEPVLSLRLRSESASCSSERQGSRTASCTAAAPAAEPLDHSASVAAPPAGCGENSAMEVKDQKRKFEEPTASTSFPEKKPRLDDRQSFRNTIDCVHSEKPQPTKEEPKVPPIRIQLSRIKPPWVVKGPPTYQICPRIIPYNEAPRRGRTGARTLADIKARAQQARAQREAAAAVAATGEGAGPGGGPGGGSDSDRGGGEHPGPDEPGGGKGTPPEPSPPHLPGAQLLQAPVEDDVLLQQTSPSVHNGPEVQPPVPPSQARDPGCAEAEICTAARDGKTQEAEEVEHQVMEVESTAACEEEHEGTGMGSREVECQDPEAEGASVSGKSGTPAVLAPTSIPDTLPRFGAQGIDTIRTLTSFHPLEGGHGDQTHKELNVDKCKASSMQAHSCTSPDSLGAPECGSGRNKVSVGQTYPITSDGNVSAGGVRCSNTSSVHVNGVSNVEMETAEESLDSCCLMPSCVQEDTGTHSDSTETASDFENEMNEDRSWCSEEVDMDGKSMPDPSQITPVHSRPENRVTSSHASPRCDGISHKTKEERDDAQPECVALQKSLENPRKGVGSNRQVSSVEANNPLVTQLLQGSLPLEKVLPQPHSANKIEINRIPVPSLVLRESCTQKNKAPKFRVGESCQSTPNRDRLTSNEGAVNQMTGAVVPKQHKAGLERSSCLFDETSNGTTPETALQQFLLLENTVGGGLPGPPPAPAKHPLDSAFKQSTTFESAVTKERSGALTQGNASVEHSVAVGSQPNTDLPKACRRSSEEASPPQSGFCSVEVVPTVKINWLPKPPLPTGVKNEDHPSCQALAKNFVAASRKEARNSADSKNHFHMEMSLVRLKKEPGKPFPRPLEASSLPFQLNIQQQFYGKLPKLQYGSSAGFNYSANMAAVDSALSGFSKNIANSMRQLRQKSGFTGGQHAALSIQAFAEGGVEEMALKCSCRLKAMIMCQGCGAFCHDDCIGPSKLCVSCLVVR
ncbi:ASXL1 protein, partial [Amia calva]|nr:ASXL1 protein [Amia calva]